MSAVEVDRALNRQRQDARGKALDECFAFPPEFNGIPISHSPKKSFTKFKFFLHFSARLYRPRIRLSSLASAAADRVPAKSRRDNHLQLPLPAKYRLAKEMPPPDFPEAVTAANKIFPSSPRTAVRPGSYNHRGLLICYLTIRFNYSALGGDACPCSADYLISNPQIF
jgi:hypothetical protein